MSIIDLTTSATALKCRLRREGFIPGLPPHITDATVRTDKATCRRLRCPGCGRCGLEYRPWRLGSRYHVLAVCPACGGAEEM
jgi:hypothetical protein